MEANTGITPVAEQSEQPPELETAKLLQGIDGFFNKISMHQARVTEFEVGAQTFSQDTKLHLATLQQKAETADRLAVQARHELSEPVQAIKSRLDTLRGHTQAVHERVTVLYSKLDVLRAKKPVLEQSLTESNIALTRVENEHDQLDRQLHQDNTMNSESQILAVSAEGADEPKDPEETTPHETAIDEQAVQGLRARYIETGQDLDKARQVFRIARQQHGELQLEIDSVEQAIDREFELAKRIAEKCNELYGAFNSFPEQFEETITAYMAARDAVEAFNVERARESRRFGEVALVGERSALQSKPAKEAPQSSTEETPPEESTEPAPEIRKAKVRTRRTTRRATPPSEVTPVISPILIDTDAGKKVN